MNHVHWSRFCVMIVFCTSMCFEVFFIVMILMHVSFACGEIGNDNDEMVK